LGLRAQWVRISLLAQREYVSLLEPIAADGVGLTQNSYAELITPLVHDDALVGVIECGPSRAGGYRESDEELVAALGHQAALAVRNSKLSAELAARLQELEASRQRIVQAEEAGRRRIERDIHDGVQQQLVALIAKVRLARNQAARDMRQVEGTLTEVQKDTTQVLDDLRELARGIHPVVLSDSGLVEAIRARVGQLPLGVRIEAEAAMRETRYPQDVEGAAYFVICEALANALKHSSAHHATVRLSVDKGTLSLEVRDDGDGFDASRTAMTGLRGLKDRVEALGGTIRVESALGVGTRVSADLPIGRQDG
jgi:signal transduction histidine kinase